MSVVLVVENDPRQSELYERELMEEGHSVWLASDGSEAIKLVKNQRPDIVVLDLHMPNRDGLDTLAHLLSIDSSLPTIIYTAYSCYKENYMSWGGDAYLVKSSDLSPLKREIVRILQDTTQQRTVSQKAEKWSDRPISFSSLAGMPV